MENSKKCCGCCNPGQYELTPGEIELLSLLAKYAFLPMALKSDGETPVYIGEKGEFSDELTSLGLKGFISLDYNMPLSGFDYVGYEKLSSRGSFALTSLGQNAVDSIELLGIEE